MIERPYIPLASPDIRSEDIAAVVDVLSSGKLVQGARVEDLERSLENFLGVKHCIAVSNGTASLHLILVAHDIGYQDEIIVPAFSYIATANVIELVGATSVFVDIDPDTFNIDTDQIERFLTPRTKAIMVVHEFGLAADMAKIKEICHKHDLLLFEDAACALGSKDDDVYAGTIGNAGSFSFHPRKAITSREGGAIVTNDSRLAQRLRALRSHGIDKDSNNDFIYAGFNYRITDFQAALLSSQLQRFEKTLERRREIAKKYTDGILNPIIKLPGSPSTKTHSWQTFHLMLNSQMEQSHVIRHLHERGVGCNYGAQCIPAQTYFRKKYNKDCSTEFPHAMRAYTHGLAIPLYEKLMDSEVDYVAHELNRIGK